MAFSAVKRMNSKIKKLTWYDMGVLKVDILAFAFLLAVLFPVLTSLHRGWYVGIILVCEAYLAWRIFGKGCGCSCGCGKDSCGCGDSGSCSMQRDQQQQQHNQQ